MLELVRLSRRGFVILFSWRMRWNNQEFGGCKRAGKVDDNPKWDEGSYMDFVPHEAFSTRPRRSSLSAATKHHCCRVLIS